MNNQQSTQMSRLDREKALYLYSNALERGDFATVEAVLYQAENDLELGQMILEVDEALQSEFLITAQADETVLIQQLLQRYLPSGFESSTEETDIPHVVVGDVISRMRTDPMLRGPLVEEIKVVQEQLPQSDTPVPENLSQQGVRQLLERLNLSVSTRFQKLFRDNAIYLLMGRRQGMAHLAATRRQQQHPHLQQAPATHEEAQS